MLVAVDGADADDSLERLGRLLVLGGEALAVAAPRRVELDDPDALAVHHAALEVVGVEVDHAGALAVQRGGRVRRREDGQRRRVEQLHPETPGVTWFFPSSDKT